MSLTFEDKLLFPSEYLQAADLKGRTVTVEIESIDPWAELRTQGGGKKQKPVVHLVGKIKKLVLNKTNATAIAEVHGGDASKWTGRRIVLKPARDKFGGKMVDCIRVDVEATRRLAPDGGAKPDPEEGSAA
jgi:hypothetical protein